MLTRVDVQSENPFFLNIRDARPTDSIIVAKIEGLDPPDIDLFMGDYARDGGYYGGRRVPPRDVTYTLEYNPNYKLNETVSGLRQMLYKAFLDPFADKKNVDIILHDDEVVDRYYTGYTSKFDGDIFSDDTTAQIVMRCPNPYIMDRDISAILGLGPTLPFEYAGTAETGVIIDATMTAASTWLQLELGGRVMVLNYGFQLGDKVYINTIRGQRRIQVTRTVAGVTTTTDILFALVSSPTSWLDIHSEANELKSYGATDSTIVATISKLQFRAQYWGV